MIKATIKKIKDILDMISSIMKSLVSIIGSLIATITVSITGYIEIKKLTSKAKMVRSEAKIAKTSSRSHNQESGTVAISGAESTPSNIGYQIDYNTGIFFMAVIVLPVIWYFEKKKRRC